MPEETFQVKESFWNIPTRNVPVARDSVFSDTPAIDDGSTMAQFFVGKGTLVSDAYGIKNQKQFITTLYVNIKTRGGTDILITDGGKYEIPKNVASLLMSLFVKQYDHNPITNIKTKQNSTMVLSTGTSIPLDLTGPHPIAGYSAWFMFVHF